jgi:hypothetical protein
MTSSGNNNLVTARFLGPAMRNNGIKSDQLVSSGLLIGSKGKWVYHRRANFFVWLEPPGTTSGRKHVLIGHGKLLRWKINVVVRVIVATPKKSINYGSTRNDPRIRSGKNTRGSGLSLPQRERGGKCGLSGMEHHGRKSRVPRRRSEDFWCFLLARYRSYWP